MEENINTDLQLDLEGIQADFEIVGSYFKDFSKHVISQGISNYPAFVAFEGENELGKPFFRKDAHRLNWNYNVSFIEQFVKKDLVKKDLLNDFLKNWGDPLKKTCVLMVGLDEARFVFIPLK